jgi:hypothetical protein
VLNIIKKNFEIFEKITFLTLIKAKPMKESKYFLLLVIAQIFLYNNAKDIITIALKKVPQKTILRKLLIFHIKNFVPTNTYKFIKNDRNVLNIKQKILKFLKK